MCAPALAALSIGSALTSYVGGQQNAAAATSAAEANYNNQRIALNEQQSQENQAAAGQANNRYMQMMVQQGRLNAISGEAGVEGISTDAVNNNSGFNATQDIAGIQTNNTWKQQQIGRQAYGAYAQEVSTINNANSKVPTLLGTGLQIAGAAGGAIDYTGGSLTSLDSYSLKS